MFKKFFLDIGANDGETTYHWTNNPEHLVIAFEPNPHFEGLLKDKVARRSNYIYIRAAVSDYIGKANFNICENEDRGCSSLLELSDDVLPNWVGRIDMIPSGKISVDVVRLDAIIEKLNIPEIEFMHCDAQGSDLKVLQGMGKYIKIVKQGTVEVANKPNALYKGQNTKEETIKFLEENGFEIRAIQSNDVYNNELNLYFVRK